ncbi:Fic family protein [Atopobium fossor]|uniref:Fic family protein n=1 Tax=Atopobium fossor TaxID=39487 RepID=UPI000418E1F1|nr:DNA-binding protein [Atopobium fossor]
MGFLSAAEIAKLWGVSERSVRNYCSQGRVPGAFLTGKTWNIPADAAKPIRSNAKVSAINPLLMRLHEEKTSKIKGGIYHKVQIELTYNSNHIEGSRLSFDQTRMIFETATIGIEDEIICVDDIVETQNHFRAIDYIIDHAQDPLSEVMIKELHRILKIGTTDSAKDWFAVGEYKRLPNEVGGRQTTLPENVAKEMKALLKTYDPHVKHTLKDIIDFHVHFECIHPFQDGNGRVGRLVMFKECLVSNVVPFIIADDMKSFYYRGLAKWNNEKGYLTDTCLAAQDRFKATLDYFRIAYTENGN